MNCSNFQITAALLYFLRTAAKVSLIPNAAYTLFTDKNTLFTFIEKIYLFQIPFLQIFEIFILYSYHIYRQP